jgi:hypothetical protein
LPKSSFTASRTTIGRLTPIWRLTQDAEGPDGATIALMDRQRGTRPAVACRFCNWRRPSLRKERGSSRHDWIDAAALGSTPESRRSTSVCRASDVGCRSDDSVTTRDCPVQTCVNSAQCVPSDCSTHVDATRHKVWAAMLAASDAHAFDRRTAARAAIARCRCCCARCVVVNGGVIFGQMVTRVRFGVTV